MRDRAVVQEGRQDLVPKRAQEDVQAVDLADARVLVRQVQRVSHSL
jgi:hypothetical protein